MVAVPPVLLAPWQYELWHVVPFHLVPFASWENVTSAGSGVSVWPSDDTLAGMIWQFSHATGLRQFARVFGCSESGARWAWWAPTPRAVVVTGALRHAETREHGAVLGQLALVRFVALLLAAR